MKTTKSVLIALKSLKYIFGNFAFLDSEKDHFESRELYSALEHFILQYFFLEKYRRKEVFAKIISFKWNSLKTLVTVDKNPYINDFLELIYEINSEFLNPELEDLNIEKFEIQKYLSLILDMLLMILIEIFSQNYNCSVLGRIQMKHDLSEIFKRLGSVLHKNRISELQDKYLTFMEVFFYNTSKEIYKYMMENFYEIPFSLSKILLISNTNQNNDKKSKLVLSDE